MDQLPNASVALFNCLWTWELLHLPKGVFELLLKVFEGLVELETCNYPPEEGPASSTLQDFLWIRLRVLTLPVIAGVGHVTGSPSR